MLQIDGNAVVEKFRRNLFGPVPLIMSCIVDEYVDGPHNAANLRNGVSQGCDIADVAGLEMNAAGFPAETFRKPSASLTFEVQERRLRLLPGELPDDGFPYAACSAGDNDRFALEIGIDRALHRAHEDRFPGVSREIRRPTIIRQARLFRHLAEATTRRWIGGGLMSYKSFGEDRKRMVTKQQPAGNQKLRSRAWFDNPDNPGMTALYLERYLNYGLTLDELRSGKPIIGIAQTGSDLSPCNRHHLELAKRVREGITAAGGVTIEFPVHPIQETGKRPTAALDRNLAYLGLVEVLYGYPLDGVVLTTG